MTARAGARCDQCGTTHLAHPNAGLGAVPEGWFVIHGPVTDMSLGVADPRWDFCSIDCLAVWSDVWSRTPPGPLVADAEEPTPP